MAQATICKVLLAAGGAPMVVATMGGTGVANYTTVLDVVAGQFITGHDYAFVLTGIVGGYRHDPGPNVQPHYAEVTPFIGVYPLGTLVQTQAFRHRWAENHFSSGPVPQQERIGTPFLMLFRKDSWGATDRLQLLAQGFFDGNIPGNTAKFDVGSVAVQVWDLTALTAAGIDWGTNFVTPSPATVLNPSTGVTTNLGFISRTTVGAKNWIVFNQASIMSRNDNQPAHVWPEVLSGSVPLHRQRVQVCRHGIALNNSGVEQKTWNHYPVGNVALVPLGTTFTVTNWGRDGHSTAPQSEVDAGGIFMIEAHSKLAHFVSDVQPQNTVADFWGNAFPWNGTLLSYDLVLSYYGARVLIGCVDSPPWAGAHGTIVEAEGTPQAGGLLMRAHSKGMGVENLPHVRASVYGAGGGTHRLVLRGGVGSGSLPPTPPNLTYTAEDCHLYGWKSVIDENIIAPVYEGPGPETPIVAPRETTVAVASLPALPFAPSFNGTRLEYGGESRESVTPSAYRTVFPKFALERASPVRFAVALSAADTATLVSFLEGLATATEPGCFRWRPPWELSDQAFGFADGFFFDVRDLGAGTSGPNAITFDAVQLTGATP